MATLLTGKRALAEPQNVKGSCQAFGPASRQPRPAAEATEKDQEEKCEKPGAASFKSGAAGTIQEHGRGSHAANQGQAIAGSTRQEFAQGKMAWWRARERGQNDAQKCLSLKNQWGVCEFSQDLDGNRPRNLVRRLNEDDDGDSDDWDSWRFGDNSSDASSFAGSLSRRRSSSMKSDSSSIVRDQILKDQGEPSSMNSDSSVLKDQLLKDHALPSSMKSDSNILNHQLLKDHSASSSVNNAASPSIGSDCAILKDQLLKVDGASSSMNNGAQPSMNSDSVISQDQLSKRYGASSSMISDPSPILKDQILKDHGAPSSMNRDSAISQGQLSKHYGASSSMISDSSPILKDQLLKGHGDSKPAPKTRDSDGTSGKPGSSGTQRRTDEGMPRWGNFQFETRETMNGKPRHLARPLQGTALSNQEEEEQSWISFGSSSMKSAGSSAEIASSPQNSSSANLMAKVLAGKNDPIDQETANMLRSLYLAKEGGRPSEAKTGGP